VLPVLAHPVLLPSLHVFRAKCLLWGSCAVYAQAAGIGAFVPQGKATARQKQVRYVSVAVCHVLQAFLLWQVSCNFKRAYA
jgi:hypothetical protein